MSQTYFVRSQGKVTGPFSFEDLKTRAARGHVKKTHQVSTDQKTWQSARSLTDLFPKPSPPTRVQRTVKHETNALAETNTLDTETIHDSDLEVVEPETVSVVDRDWYYCPPGEEEALGPFSLDALRSMANRGELPPETLVWHEDLGDWQPFEDVNQLRTLKKRRPRLDDVPPSQQATVSLILAILSIPTLGVTSVFAILFGLRALKHIQADEDLASGKPFARTGLILGSITATLAVIGLCVWIWFELFAE